MKDIVSKRIKKAVYNIPQGYEARIEGNKVIVETKENEYERIWIINYLSNRILNSNIIAEKENLKKAIAWLEKKGEQKPADKVEPKFKIGDYVKNVNDKREPIYEIVYMDKECYICEYRGKERMGDKAVMHFAFDNPYLRLVEPKFKVGDIITNGKIIGKVDENENNKYHGWFGYDKDLSVHYADIPDVENWHKWTIEDAKDGDVLCTKNKCPFIYDKGRYNNGLAYYYAGIDVSGNLNIKSPHNMLAHFGRLDNIRPATKEQRDLLFEKMHEAGYEWDAEHKQLNKIEQKSATMSLDEAIEHCKEKSCGNNACALEHKQLEKWLIELKELKERKPAEWSEEDKKRTNHIIQFLEDKDRWKDSERSFPIEEDIRWLKDLKPQNRWKPTAAQMYALKKEVENKIYSGGDIDLSSLYHDLTKLL